MNPSFVSLKTGWINSECRSFFDLKAIMQRNCSRCLNLIFSSVLHNHIAGSSFALYRTARTLLRMMSCALTWLAVANKQMIAANEINACFIML